MSRLSVEELVKKYASPGGIDELAGDLALQRAEWELHQQSIDALLSLGLSA